MKKIILMLAAALTMSAWAANRTSSADGGDWYSPSSWESGLFPVAGDSALIGGTSKMTISAGETVTNTFFYLYRDSTGGAELELLSGSCVTNCSVRFGITSGTPSEDAVSRVVMNDGSSFVKEAGSGDGKGTEFTTYAGNEFIQKGGLVMSDVNESFSSRALYDQQGGTNSASIVQISAATFDPETFTSYHLHRGAYLDVASFMVSGGTAILEGDWNTSARPGRGKTQFYSGGVNDSFGRILFRNVTNEIANGVYIGTHSSQTRNNPTGIVDFVDSEIRFNSATLSIATKNGVNGRGIVRFDNSRALVPAGITLLDVDALTVRNGRTASLVVSNKANLALMSSSFGGNPWTCTDADFFAWQAGGGASIGFTMYPGADVLVENGTMRVGDRFYFGGGTLRIGRNGKFACYRSYSTATTTAKTVGSGEIILEDGGELYVHSGDFSIGPLFNNAGAAPNVCDQTFRMRGGTMTLPAGMMKLGVSGNTTRFELSGGTMPTNAILLCMASGSVEISFKGSSYAADISAIGTNSTSSLVSDDMMLEFVLDKSTQHIRPVNMSGANNGGRYAPRRCGNLRVKLDGGILVTDRDEFPIMTTSHNNSTFTAFGGAGDFVSLPDPALWEEVLSSNSRTCSVRLVSTDLAADWNEGVVTMPAPMAMGSLCLQNVSTNNMREMMIAMSLNAPDGSSLGADALTALKDGLVAAGYTNSICDVASPYNLTAVVPADAIGSGNRRFAWDFTETKGIKTIGAVVTNAVLTEVAFKPHLVKSGLRIIFR